MRTTEERDMDRGGRGGLRERIRSSRWAITYSLGLLEPRDRRQFRQVVFAQMATSIFDLIGVMLLGAVGLLAAAAADDQPIPPGTENALGYVGLANRPIEEVTVILAVVATAMLVLKGVVISLLLRRSLTILAVAQIGVAKRLTAQVMSQPFFVAQRKTSHDAAWTLGIGLQMAIGALLSSYAVALTEFALIVLLIGALFIVSAPTTAFMIIYFGLIGVVLHRTLGRWSHRVEAELAGNYVGGQRAIQESLTLYPEITVSGRRSVYENLIDDRLARTATYSADQAFIAQLPKFAYESALVVGMIAVAGIQLASGDIEAVVAVIAVFLAAGVRLLPSLVRLQNAIVALRARSANVRRVKSFIDNLGSPVRTTPAPFDIDRFRESVAQHHRGFTPSVEIRDAIYRYPNSESNSIDDISLRVEPGESVAIVGPTGAGKTSLIALMLGVMPLTSGSILINSQPPAAAVSSFPGSIAYVPQVIALVHGSVRQNVALGLPAEVVDDELVWRALETAHLADYLRSERMGLDTEVGEHGAQLSGGQRQRLGIARALYSKPRLIVLDEATSALDLRTESLVTQTLTQLRGSATLVTVAHKIPTMKAADRVIHIEGGKLAAEGTFDELIDGSAEFRIMIESLKSPEGER